jgi:hypothetical protein
MFSSGRSMMLSSLRSSEPEPLSVENFLSVSTGEMPPVEPRPSFSDATVVEPKKEEVKEKHAEEKKEDVKEEEKKEEDEDKYLAAAEEDEDGVPKIDLFCMCQKPWNPNQFMVGCDTCNEWYHDTCLGIPQEDLEKLDKFMCMWCVEKGKRREQRRKQWEADKSAKTAARKARQAARKRELQTLAKRARAKPCKNAQCTQRCRPNSKSGLLLFFFFFFF